jgi:hypothetical protein
MMLSTAIARRCTLAAATAVCLLTPAVARAHVQLLAPDGGEVLDPGSVFEIEWRVVIPHNQQNWDLWYSTTGRDGPWVDIAMDLPTGDSSGGSIHTFEWTVPDVPTQRARVRVRQDNLGGDYYDISDHNFTITPEPGTLSLLTLGALCTLRRRRRFSDARRCNQSRR